ncbi:hypothetical protein P3441_23190 [Vibrio parahaemolyticus]|nr:hypothetical protein [Vibrio parahaemolyticus]MDF4453007.1 hypothetical protein [Vibrio parahaemolyticus]
MLKIKMIFFVIALALSVLSAYIYQFGSMDLSHDQSIWGSFGDYVGGVLNPVIALLALIYIVKTYNTQKEELIETKNALSQSASAQKEQAIAQKLANELQKKANDLEKVNQQVNLLQAEVSCITSILDAELNGQNTLIAQLNECSKELEDIGNDVVEQSQEHTKKLMERTRTIQQCLTDSDQKTQELQHDLAKLRDKVQKMYRATTL